MNERIRELAERAGAVTFGGKICLFGDQDIEKFAELIVKKCANYALEKGKASPDTDFRTGSLIISEFLLAHFGVEE